MSAVNQSSFLRKKVIFIFYAKTIFIDILASVWGPVYAHYYGATFSPSELSLLSMVGLAAGSFQFLMNKVSEEVSIKITPLLILFTDAVKLVAFICGGFKALVYTSVIIAPFNILFVNHYAGVFHEVVIKNYMKLQIFENNFLSVTSFTGLIGAGIAYIVTKHHILSDMTIFKTVLVIFILADIASYYNSRLVLRIYRLENSTL